MFAHICAQHRDTVYSEPRQECEEHPTGFRVRHRTLLSISQQMVQGTYCNVKFITGESWFVLQVLPSSNAISAEGSSHTNRLCGARLKYMNSGHETQKVHKYLQLWLG